MGSGLNAGNVLCSQTREQGSKGGTCNNRFAQQCGRRASQVNGTCCCWYKVAVILCFFTMSSSLQLCHKLRLDAVHKLEKYTFMIYVDCQASWYCEFQKLSLTPDPIFLLTIVKKPQCTKSLGPNQPQNLKLRHCIWQQGSLFLILSYPGLFKNIPHVWFLRLYSLIKNSQHDFPKMRGGGQRPFGTFPKIHPFWNP